LTRNMISRERLGMMKADASLINVSRAALVDYAALADYMRRGHLSGAILDVHSPEPLAPDSELWDTPNVMITPHISCDDPRYVDLLLDEWVINFRRYQTGQPLRNIVDREAGY
jgi:phosphoglycerate dehydrogenase-like enzyme